MASVSNNDKPSWWDELLKTLTGGFGETRDILSAHFNTAVDKVIKAIADTITDIKNTIQRVIKDVIDYIGDAFTGLIESAKSIIIAAVDSLMSYVNDIIDSIKGYIDRAINAITDFVDSVLSYIQEMIQGFIDRVSDFISAVVDKVESLFETAANYLSSLYDSVVETITSIYDSVIDYLKDTFEVIVETFSEFVETTLEKLESVYRHIEETVIGIIDDAGEIINKALSEITETTREIVDGLGDLIGSLNADVIPKLSMLTKYAGLPFGIGETPESKEVSSKAVSGMEAIFEHLSKAAAGKEDYRTVISGTSIADTALNSVLKSIIVVLANVSMLTTAAGVANAANIESFQQLIYQENPIKEYSISDSVNLAARGFIDKSQALNSALKNGYDNEKTQTLINAAYRPLDVERGIQAYLRQQISAEDFRDICGRNGINTGDYNILRGLINPIPPIQDLITMAVRDVFSPDISAKFQLLEGLPDDFVRWGEKSGLTKEWAAYYWGAHWRLPSANQGFEMYHRGFIDQETLRLLLRALDVSPFWRDKLEKIAYTPITRVDVRRMYKLGVLDRDGVVRRYRDVGYSPEDAELLADFTEQYTEVDEEDSDIDTKQLSMSQTRRLWDLGTISDGDAVQALINVGYSHDLARTLVESWSDEEEIKYREDLIRRYTRRAIREDMDDRQVETLFNPLNLTVEEITRAKRIIAVERSEYHNLPTKAELAKMYSVGAITEGDWYNAMRLHGYSYMWIDAYKTIYKIGAIEGDETS